MIEEIYNFKRRNDDKLNLRFWLVNND
jgi:hypothetical protein